MTDELKPVRCGCGGEAKVSTWTGSNATVFNDCNAVYCENCGMQTKKYSTEAEAVEAWNRAMGERTAKVGTAEKPIVGSDSTITVTACGDCGTVVSIFDRYCPGCGCRLIWEED